MSPPRRVSRFVGWGGGVIVGASLALVLALLTASIANAQPAKLEPTLRIRRARIDTHRGWVTLTVSWRDIVDAKIRGKLLSGLPTVIAVRAYVFPNDGSKPVALSASTCRIVYDLWDEVFRIELNERGRRRQTIAINIEGVLRRCGEARRRPLVQLRYLDATQPLFVATLVEVNPLHKEMRDRIRRWVALPKGAGAVGPGDSLFGSFVGLFVTQVPHADKRLAFRSQGFTVRALPESKEP